MYYNALFGVSTTAVCGYGNHDACESKECQCPYQLHAFADHGKDKPAEPKADNKKEEHKVADHK